VTRRPDKADLRAHRNAARTVGDLGAVELVTPPVLGAHLPQSHVLVKTIDGALRVGRARSVMRTHRLAQGTILLIGSSIMSVAPASFSSGINLFIVSLGTTVSTA
jgi:hypothetical protein